MSDGGVNRRGVLGALGAIVASSVVASEAEGSSLFPARERRELPAASIIAPLVAGRLLGHWRVERVIPLDEGALSVVFADRAGETFQLDVCAKDPAPDAPRGPAASEHFEVFLANGGDGNKSTREDHGLAAMALAEVIRSNEAHESRAGFATLSARMAERAARVHTTG